MALPRWLARLNRDVTNRMAVKSGSWPLLVHVGRVSGQTYRTPLGVYPVEGGYLFTVNYGTRTDWARNVVHAGRASLEMEGETIALKDPRLVDVDTGYGMLSSDAKVPPSFVGVEQCLVVSSSDRSR
jgi:deazaflavin-dependent oxidoreductase (nitroreductase family)